MRVVPKLIFGLFVLAIFCSGCGQKKGGLIDENLKNTATEACQQTCRSAKAAGQDLASGPCLSNEIAEDWVCDFAHLPRQAIDNQAANQCASYRSGQAHNFIELDLNCEVIQK